MLRYGHLRTAPVVVDAFLRTEREPPTLRAALWLSTRFGASSMACCLSYDVRSLFHMAKCQVQKDATDALSMRNIVRSLTPGGWSKVAKVLEVPQTQFV